MSAGMTLDQVKEVGAKIEAELDEKLEKVQADIQKAEAKVEKLQEQKDAIKNKKAVSQDQTQSANVKV